jgi:hypothetical protein
MNQRAQIIKYLERSGTDSSLGRALAARLDTAFKRAGVTSARAAKWLSVSESDVQFWRQGITVPPLNVFTRIAAFLDLDVHWLCTGQTRVAPVAFEAAA